MGVINQSPAIEEQWCYNYHWKTQVLRIVSPSAILSTKTPTPTVQGCTPRLRGENAARICLNYGTAKAER
jgi:hypothetical protein